MNICFFFLNMSTAVCKINLGVPCLAEGYSPPSVANTRKKKGKSASFSRWYKYEDVLSKVKNKKKALLCYLGLDYVVKLKQQMKQTGSNRENPGQPGKKIIKKFSGKLKNKRCRLKKIMEMAIKISWTCHEMSIRNQQTCQSL